MKKLLILDMWYGLGGGPNKNNLYAELSKLFDLEILKVDVPSWLLKFNYILSFDFNLKKWKEKKKKLDDAFYKKPGTFHLRTYLYNKKIASLKSKYDAILQIGVLFGPIDNPLNVPCFSYNDSTVFNAEAMWPQWLPASFKQFKKEWYEIETKCFQKLTGSLLYSNWVADTLVKHYGVKKENTFVVGSALKMVGDFDINHAQKKQDVVFVSTDFERKGGYKLPKIFEQVVREVPNAKLVIIGPVPFEFKFQAQWLDIKGVVGRDELKGIYMKSSILIHPAKYDPFPSVIFEAANFELPCVASDVCGIPEMIKNGETGFFVKQDDVNQFAEKVIYLLKDKAKCMNAGKKARKYVQKIISSKNRRF